MLGRILFSCSIEQQKLKPQQQQTYMIMHPTHYSNESIRFQTTFVLQNESTLQTKVIQDGVWFQNGQADLFPLLSSNLSDIKNLNFKVYDFKFNKYMDIQVFGHRFYVPTRLVQNSNGVVLIKYLTNYSETLSVNSLQNSIQHQIKSEIYQKRSQRSKQRTIVEVIQIVKKWRNLHQSKNGNSMSLPEAAEILGLPKKSLDDYFYQLRMGEKYGFQFHNHMMDGIGVLRSFLKKFKSHRKGDKNQKLPSQLKISNQITKYEKVIKCSLEHIQVQECEKMEEQKEEKQVCQKSQKEQIQQSFYNEFNYDFNKETDPFLNLEKGSPESKNIFNIDINLVSNFDLFYD